MHLAVSRTVAGAVLFALSLGAQAATTLVLNAVADNSLFSESNALSDGAGPHLWVGQTAGGVNRRALVRFDLSALPQDHVVVGARLRIFMSRTISPDQEISVRRVTASWGEGTSSGGSGGTGGKASAADATWGFRFFGAQTPWTLPGGDFIAGQPSATTVVGVAGATYTWSGSGLVADVQAWRASAADNFGWILIGNETERSAMRFNSRNEFGAPTLELDLIPASANVPIPMAWVLLGGCVMLSLLLKQRR